MLKFKDFDLLNENLNRARAVLRQVGVPENNPNFIKLRELLRNNLGYTGKFTEWMFLQKVEFSQLQNLYNRIKDERLSKPIDQFKTPEEVIDSLIRTNTETDINQILNAIPGRTRQFLKDCDDFEQFENFLKQHAGKKDALIDFFSKKGGRYGSDYDEYEVIDQLIEDLEKIVDAKSISDISKLAQTSKNIKLVFEDEKALIVAVNYDGIKEVGSNYWCIVEDEDTFNDYVIQTDEPTIQLVVYSKDKIPFVDDKSVLGITWRLSGGGSIDAAHWEDDSEFSSRGQADFIKFLKSLNSKLLEILPTIYDISEIDWAFSMPEFFMPKLEAMIEAWQASGITKPIENFITNWLSWTSDRYDFDQAKGSVFYKKVIPTLKATGIKLSCFDWEDIINFNLFEITQFTKSLLRDNIFSVLDVELDNIFENDEERKNFYLWLIENKYPLDNFAEFPNEIMDLIRLKVIPIEKLYKKINFNQLDNLSDSDQIFILDWIRDNDLPHLLSQRKGVYYVLETLSKKAKKYSKEIKELLSDRDVYERVKNTVIFKNLLLSGDDEMKLMVAKTMIPKVVFDQFDVVLTMKKSKDIEPKTTPKKPRSKDKKISN